MATPTNFNGTTYNIPANGESGWGTDVSNLLIALATTSALNTTTTTSSTTTALDTYIIGTADTHVVLTNTAARAVTLPTGVNGRILRVTDGASNSFTNNITLTPSGSDKIWDPYTGAEVTSFSIDSDSATLSIQFRGTRWYVL